MATIIAQGTPSTLILSDEEVHDIAHHKTGAEQKAALTRIKKRHDLPTHAPTYRDNGGAWLHGDAIFLRGEKLPDTHYVTLEFANGLRCARHQQIG